MTQYIGIDVGGSFIKYGVIDEEGTILFHDKTPTRRTDPELVIDTLVEIIKKITQNRKIAGVGISIPGVINPNGRLMTSGALDNLYHYDVQSIVAKRADVKTLLVNDAKAIAYAEKWLGAGRNYDNFVCLPLGTGVGGSIVVNGKVLQGRVGAAGEFGMMLMGLGKTNPVGYESASFYCGAIAGLCRMYSNKIGKTAFNEWETDIKYILQLAHTGDSNAQESLKEFYQNIAVLLLNISVSLDPEQILIGGGISENEEIMEGIRLACTELIERYSDISVIGFPEIRSCQLGNTAGMIGAVSKFIEGENKK